MELVVTILGIANMKSTMWLTLLAPEAVILAETADIVLELGPGVFILQIYMIYKRYLK